MANETSTRNVYFVLGEASGDALAAKIMDEMTASSSVPLAFHGIAGDELSARGVQSLFDIDDIAVMGIAPILKRLPLLVRRIYQTVADIVDKAPDIVVLVDSPEFCAQVAKRVRKKLPHTPIVKYVCPSVWAWRPSRAGKMTKYIDHIFCLLPFEPHALSQLAGPSASYVGHPLVETLSQFEAQPKQALHKGQKLNLLLLPGSRSAEIERSLPKFLSVAERLSKTHELQITVQTLPKRTELVRKLCAASSLKVDVLSDQNTKYAAFASADMALATSGTVSLELALCHVPHIVFYELGFLERLAARLITTWSVNLPNLIADKVIVPEAVGSFATEERLYRELKALCEDGLSRQAQAKGFEEVWTAAKVEVSPAKALSRHLNSRYLT